MRFIRIFSELSGQLRYASQKRVLAEIAFIKLTKPSMEQNLDSVLQRLNMIEKRMEEIPAEFSGLAAMAAQGGEAGQIKAPETARDVYKRQPLPPDGMLHLLPQRLDPGASQYHRDPPLPQRA